MSGSGQSRRSAFKTLYKADSLVLAAVSVSPLLLANAGLSVGDTVSVSTIGTSGVDVLEADKLTLIHDGKGKASKDSFFEAYVKEVLGKLP